MFATFDGDESVTEIVVELKSPAPLRKEVTVKSERK